MSRVKPKVRWTELNEPETWNSTRAVGEGQNESCSELDSESNEPGSSKTPPHSTFSTLHRYDAERVAFNTSVPSSIVPSVLPIALWLPLSTPYYLDWMNLLWSMNIFFMTNSWYWRLPNTMNLLFQLAIHHGSRLLLLQLTHRPKKQNQRRCRFALVRHLQMERH